MTRERERDNDSKRVITNICICNAVISPLKRKSISYFVFKILNSKVSFIVGEVLNVQCVVLISVIS